MCVSFMYHIYINIIYVCLEYVYDIFKRIYNLVGELKYRDKREIFLQNIYIYICIYIFLNAGP